MSGAIKCWQDVLQDPSHSLNETTLKGLDIVVEEARLAGLKLILSLADNWKYPGGVDEYVDRSESAPKRSADQQRPPDQLGDADLTARLPCFHAFDSVVLCLVMHFIGGIRKMEVSREVQNPRL